MYVDGSVMNFLFNNLLIYKYISVKKKRIHVNIKFVFILNSLFYFLGFFLNNNKNIFKRYEFKSRRGNCEKLFTGK